MLIAIRKIAIRLPQTKIEFPKCGARTRLPAISSPISTAPAQKTSTFRPSSAVREVEVAVAPGAASPLERGESGVERGRCGRAMRCFERGLIANQSRRHLLKTERRFEAD